MSPNPKLVIVEHDPELLEALATPLNARGYQVVGAHSWSDALTVLRLPELPAALVVDVSSAGFDASPLAAALVKDDRLRALPLVVLANCCEIQRQPPPSTVAVLIGRPVRSRLLVDVVERLARSRRAAGTDLAAAHEYRRTA